MTITENVRRLLKHWGLDSSVRITKAAVDRVYGWDDNGLLLKFVIANAWVPDNPAFSLAFHGAITSFREPGNVSPAMQVTFHPMSSAYATNYFVEIDLDYAAPTTIPGFFKHAKEVISNVVTRRKTDQKKIAKLLTKRGIA